jgi:hypothetical protein
LYRRVKSRPPADILSEEQMVQLQEKKQKEAQVSRACLQYLSMTGPFKSWEKTRKNFETVNVRGGNIH